MDSIQDNVEEQQAKNQKDMRFDINDSVWIAAAAMTYEIYNKKQNAGQPIYVPDFAFVQSDIRNRTEVINGHRAEGARTSQWCCGDHENHTHCYLRAIEDKRRLSFPGEFDGKEEPESLKMAEVIFTDVGNITIRKLHDFVHKEYATLEEQIIRKTDIDYKTPLEYIDKHSKEEYAGPNKSVPSEQRAKMDELKDSAQNAVKQIQKMMTLCEKRFHLRRFKGVKWLDGSNAKTKHYLWGQLKNPDNMESPISISIFVDKNSETLQPRYRISLEIMDKDASKALMKQYHGYLDMEPDARHGLTYVCDSNESEYVKILKESYDTIKAQVETGVYHKVQYCKMIDRNEAYSNEDYERQILEGVAALMPFYKHVVGISKPDYWSTKGEYYPGISVEMWKELLADPEVTLVENLQMFKMMLELGGETTCAKLAEVYGGSYALYNGLGEAFGERVYQKTNCPLCTDGDRKRLYTIPFVGREVIEDGKNRYSWKIRGELQEALESMELSEIDIKKKQNINKAFPKNMILYGPPGTGKTYNTVKYAVAICEGKPLSEYDQMDYVDILRRYENYKAKGRIAFTTFHQSYGYEEFIEGIKPVLISDDDENESKDIQYDVMPGLFKSFCKNASMKWVSFDKVKYSDIEIGEKIWKVTIREEVRQDCYDNNRVRIDWLMDSEGASGFVNNMETGNIIITTNGSRRCINGIAKVVSDEAYELDAPSDKTTRDVIWLAKGINEDIVGINAGKMFHRKTVTRVPQMKFEQLIPIIKRANPGMVEKEDEDQEPYVFIIDEINRGNISKIFGELITLIEETKRAGAEEAMETVLPYSGDTFNVPNNVYILGTMNTADRSIALMDTALRRRFDFVEMMPDSIVLSGITIEDNGKTIDVAKMLDVINERIAFLYDREHTIGHAFFTKLINNPSFDVLADIFRSKVLPLLQEYFYEDYAKIQLVLGDNDKSNPMFKFILDEPVKVKSIFKGNPEDIVDLPEKKYVIHDEAFEYIQSYIEIE